MRLLNDGEEIPADAAMVIVNKEGDIELHFAGDPKAVAMEVGSTEAKLQEDRFEFRSERDFAVADIKVTTAAGNVFDGDEVSQQRMARAIIVMDDVQTIPWTLADNTIVDATKVELTEALALSGAAQSALWQP